MRAMLIALHKPYFQTFPQLFDRKILFLAKHNLVNFIFFLPKLTSPTDLFKHSFTSFLTSFLKPIKTVSQIPRYLHLVPYDLLLCYHLILE